MKKYLILPIVLVAMMSCNSEKSSYDETTDKTAELVEKSDTTPAVKIIKTADMRFRVKNVQQTKEKLTAVISSEKGTLSQFSIHSEIQRSEKVRYSADSLIELTSYQTEGLITAKIPSDQIASFTDKVARLAIFIDEQSMTMDDQSIAYLANKLKNENRVEAVASLKKNANQKSNNAEQALRVKDSYVDNKIENLSIDNLVAYSTITLNFYQDNTIQKLVVVNDRIEDYRPQFSHRLWLNMLNGWSIFMELILAIANMWMIILFIFIAYFVYKHYRKQTISVPKSI